MHTCWGRSGKEGFLKEVAVDPAPSRPSRRGQAGAQGGTDIQRNPPPLVEEPFWNFLSVPHLPWGVLITFVVGPHVVVTSLEAGLGFAPKCGSGTQHSGWDVLGHAWKVFAEGTGGSKRLRTEGSEDAVSSRP